MNCSGVSCGFNAFVKNGTCMCSENSFGSPDEICTSYLEFFWYSINSFILLIGTICCCKNQFKRRKYNEYNDEIQFFSNKNDF
jgi:hypothetical protein